MSQHHLATRNAPRLPRDDPGNKARRAWENRAHVRRVLGERQPEFARALGGALRDLCPHGFCGYRDRVAGVQAGYRLKGEQRISWLSGGCPDERRAPYT